MIKKTSVNIKQITNSETVETVENFLLSRGYTYGNRVWYCNNKPCAVSDVKSALIQYAKSRKIENAGSWSDDALKIGRRSFKLLLKRAVPRLVRKSRNAGRVAGKDVVKQVLHALDRDVDDISQWCQKNGCLVSKIYDMISMLTGAVCKSSARVCGVLCRSVFCGLQILYDVLNDIRYAVLHIDDDHDYDVFEDISDYLCGSAGSAVSRC